MELIRDKQVVLTRIDRAISSFSLPVATAARFSGDRAIGPMTASAGWIGIDAWVLITVGFGSLPGASAIIQFRDRTNIADAAGTDGGARVVITRRVFSEPRAAALKFDLD